MIAHLRGRERKLEALGWTGDDAEWIALVCLHSGVFTRAQFCDYFDTFRKHAHRFVKTLIERRQAVETDLVAFNGGGKTCRISSHTIYRALGVENIRHRQEGQQPGRHAAAFVPRFCAGTSGYELAPRRVGEGRVF